MEPKPTLRDELFAIDERDDGRLEAFVWRQVRELWARRWFIVGITGIAAIVATVVLLLIPNEYRASARVLSPDSGSVNPISAMLGRNLSSAAATLLGGSSGEYARYLTILTSRSFLEQVVDEFDLVTVYETEDGKHPKEDAIKELAGRTNFPVDLEYEFLSVSVLDRSPERAADIANYMVGLLNERNSRLSSQSASSFRNYMENRYATSISATDSLLDASQDFQRRYGIYDVDAQTAAFFDQMAVVSGALTQREIEFEAMQQQYGADNPQVRAFAQAVTSARRRYQSALAGGEDIMPVPQAEMPEVVRQYLTLERDLTIERTILEAVAPMLETARLQEEQQSEALQVVDAATPPVKKEWPRRSILLIVVTMSAFMLASLLVLMRASWREHSPRLRSRLYAEVGGRG